MKDYSDDFICDFEDLTSGQVADYLANRGIDVNRAGFVDEGIDGAIFLQLTSKDVYELKDKIFAPANIKNVKRTIAKLAALKSKTAITTTTVLCSNGVASNSCTENVEYSRHASFRSANHPPVKRQFSYNLLQQNNSSDSDVLNSERNEFFRCCLAFVYCFCCLFVACVSMTLVHNRVPDMSQYPPLPDIVLDILPFIPWAFEACEALIISLNVIFFFVIVFHRYRFVILKRFFAISGTIFLLRSVTMFVTSLSVPGVHLTCTKSNNKSVQQVLERSFEILLGFGMTIKGVNTCGDYMFSGHSALATTLSLFSASYVNARYTILHNVIWMIWGFCLYMLLAAHEHYTVDVIIAIYISVRTFQYYHTLLIARNINRNQVKFWYPIFYLLENPIETAWVPNEYQSPFSLKIFKEYIQKIKPTNSVTKMD